ncbi:PepSY domain-containing protein [Hyphomicrobium sp.]|uniref:PepSY-associated TM helix domain-containing protein n=1 Tax=Hyphomicrobium sp. TaxID=82 RepID=UPI000F962623|nr:PepSY domain-containing protein [Hyphomicrobium sp.]RUO98807.1 MAG: PepSY domain-containing protein [Hyphomicrobium sp.]
MNTRLYNAVWRWHFYAGLFCVPFVIWLSCTGAIYLWRPQIEAWLDRPYDTLSTQGSLATPDAQVAAAVAAVPGSQLRKYFLPATPTSAIRVLVDKDGVLSRVYVDPRSLQVLSVQEEESRPFRLIFHLHGELLAGAWGSYLVEIAACWTIVMLLTGIYLWWPRGRTGLAGVLYPRLTRGGRMFWRDIHATAGFWVSVFALILILTGLPWAKGWGTYLMEVRQLTGTARGPVDWTIGGKAPKEMSMPMEHAMHMAPRGDLPAVRSGELPRVIDTAVPLTLAPPVAISPPKREGGPWSVTSEAANRPLRADLKVDGATGELLERKNFADRHWIDQTIGYGVAVHEGMLFGLANQIIGTLTAVFLVLLSVSGVMTWWKRRPQGVLGAPMALQRPATGFALIASVVALAVYMPMFAATLVLVLLLEALVLRRIPAISRWLGLRRAETIATAV